MEKTVEYLERELSLPVNKEKSQVAEVRKVTFLGFQILRGKIRVSNKAKKKFKDRVRQFTRRNNPLSTYQIIQELNAYLRGWVSYFGAQEFKTIFRDFDGWIRSRLRSMQLKKLNSKSSSIRSNLSSNNFSFRPVISISLSSLCVNHPLLQNKFYVEKK